jgi:preprotein translocase subunit YajC
LSLNDLLSLLPIIAIAAIFWLLIIRPAQRRAKETAALQAALSVGDEVMLTSGVFGTIVAAADDHLQLEIAPGVVIRVVRGAVASIRAQESAEGAESGEPGTDQTEER